MKIELQEVTIEELTDGFLDNSEGGVVAYGGKLDVRPPYQREFIYKDKQRDAVIDSVRKDFPLNVMYWAVRDDGKYEVIDGQQRTISICQYVNGDFSIDGLAFHNLKDDRQKQITGYKLMVYLCSGTDTERLEWFETINIAGEELTKQEMRNAVYAGPWVSDAKKYFSRNQCVASSLGGDYMSGSANRQEYLETVIDWISGGQIKEYMSKHQKKPNAKSLWLYFQAVIAWVKATFPTYRGKVMKGVEWGELYNTYKEQELDPAKLEAEISKLMADDDVENKKGIYRYVLDRNEKHLNIRKFTDSQKLAAFERQKGKCPVCKKVFTIELMEGDHITPWHAGGKTIPANCQMLCKEDNRRKSEI
ncbi:HNH endonuclease family protein [Anatilimnocola sp. NA78]|uniref:HNH endonuclease family protein n=1 Tax=Anatilimnocola sp. NA78 TaxID=3415683 RepID=UPI003CE53184